MPTETRRTVTMTVGTAGDVHAPELPYRRKDSRRSTAASLALLPLMISIPFTYWPKVTESDTQPWVVIGAAIAFLFYWPRGLPQQRAGLAWMTALVPLALLSYWLRDPETEAFVRYGAILVTFLMVWHVASRGLGDAVGTAVRFTVALWFAIGVYQTVSVLLGLPADFFGRYVPGRTGVPSLTAEPSFYGSLSVLQVMYLLTERSRRRRNRPFIVMATLSALLSGSLLSNMLLLIPAARLSTAHKLAGVVGLVILASAGFSLLDSPFATRLANLGISNLGPDLLQIDPSTNLRFGHIWFTFSENLFNELTFRGSINFLTQYNAWANSTGIFTFTESDSILPSGGELLFRSGPAGLGLIIAMAVTASRTSSTLADKLTKISFVLACLLNPISLANPVLIFYVQKRYSTR